MRSVLASVVLVAGSVTQRSSFGKHYRVRSAVAPGELFNINRTRLENLIHRIFSPARLDIEIKDRFGNPVIPREWFLVPLFVVDEAVERIKDGTIASYVYDPAAARLRER